MTDAIRARPACKTQPPPPDSSESNFGADVVMQSRRQQIWVIGQALEVGMVWEKDPRQTTSAIPLGFPEARSNLPVSELPLAKRRKRRSSPLRRLQPLGELPRSAGDEEEVLRVEWEVGGAWDGVALGVEGVADPAAAVPEEEGLGAGEFVEEVGGGGGHGVGGR